jgi:hypothetical protein
MGISKFFGKSSAEGLPPYGYRYLEHILGDVFAALKDDEQLPERIKGSSRRSNGPAPSGLLEWRPASHPRS